MATITTESVGVPGYGVELVSKTYTAAALPNGDTVEMIKVPAGARIVEVTADYANLGANTAITVGDGGSANRFVTTTATTSAGIVRLLANRNYQYAAADTIDITNSGSAAATGAVTLTVWFYRDYR